MSATATSRQLFVAVRCEELPSRFVGLAAEQLSKNLLGLLGGIEHGAVRTWSTPRRIAVVVEAVAEGRTAEEKLVTGPPAAAAFRDGEPTKAAIGFARGKGVAVEDLEFVDGPRGRVIAARVRTGGQRSTELVAAGLEAAITGVRFPMSMRWRKGAVRWARPIHGVIATYGGEVIAAELPSLGLQTGSRTIGHRLSPEPLDTVDEASWLHALREHDVEPDPAVRTERIRSGLAVRAAEAGAELRLDEGLLAEVTNLVEWPVAVLCEFDEELLELPPRLLVEAMRVHQRTFPLWRGDGGRGEGLDHHFVAVSNHPLGEQPETAATIANGNAKVIGARFHDARFFYAEDRKLSLTEHDVELAKMRWIRDGGTMQDKARRIGELARDLSPRFEADPDAAERAGRLCKADLATQMVGEFPELQGHVGRLLAGFDGEPAEVALAIEEHYLPRSSGDALPTTVTGRVVALADRLDTLAGCFACGIRIKGSSDPLGLRRAAIGLLGLVLDSGERVGLRELLTQALSIAPRKDGVDLGSIDDDLVAFVETRLRALLRESIDTEVVDAVLASTGAGDPVALRARAQALAELAATSDFAPIKRTFKRALGLIKDHGSPAYEVEGFEDPVEHALHEALLEVTPRARAASAALDFRGALAALATLKSPVDALFDGVMVMAEDPALRSNRLGLLRAVAEEFRRVADLTLLSAE